mgnify:CR=1 FL=1
MVTEEDIEAFREMNAEGFAAIHKMIRMEEQGLGIKRYFSEDQLRMAARVPEQWSSSSVGKTI